MKKIVIHLTIVTSLLAVGCKKDQINESSSSNAAQSSYLKLSNEQYEHLTTSLEKEFNPGNQQTVTVKQEDMLTQDPSKMPVDKLVPVDVQKVIAETESIINKYPELANHKSMLTVYHEALTMKDKMQLRQFVTKYSRFLILIEEFDYVMLKVPRNKAALLTPDGLIQVNGQIRKYYGEGMIKVIENGDPALIASLDRTNESTEQIRVYKNPDVSGKATIKHNGTIIYHPASSLYAVALVHYVDEDIYWSSSGGFNYYQCKYRAGAQAACFFNSVPMSVPIFNLSTWTTCTGYGTQGNVNNRSNTSTNNTVMYYETPYTTPSPTYIPASSFQSGTDVGIVYPNNVVLTGAWVY